MDKCTVLIDDWQIQCCGNPFNIGDSVGWIVEKWDNDWPFYMDVGTIDYYYEHHSADYEKLFKICGKVTRIQALYYICIPNPADPQKAVKPGKIIPVVNQADGWEDDITGQEFDSYFACLEDVHITPAKKSDVPFC